MERDEQRPTSRKALTVTGRHRVVDVLGVGIAAVDLDGALEVINGWIDRGERHYVCAVDVNSLMQAQWNPRVLDVLNGAGLATADGSPLLWAARYAGCQEAGRVAGPRLMPALCRVAAKRGLRVFFLGGSPGVAEQVADAMTALAPKLEVVGTASPPFVALTSAEEATLVGQINAARPDIVWVALGAPKQELWMAQHRAALDASVLIGVGAAFAIAAGLVPAAPSWIQPTGLEWAYRIAREPKRLIRRYLRSHPAFVAAVVRRRPYLRTAPDKGSSGG